MIGQRVKELRLELGVTAERLSELARISRSTLADIESGITLRPQSPTVKALADALGVSPADLVAGRDWRLVDQGWWPPEKVRVVTEAIAGLAATSPYEKGLVENGLSVEFMMRHALLRHAAGFDATEVLVREARKYLENLPGPPEPPPVQFPVKFETSAQLLEFVVRYRSGLDKASPSESLADVGQVTCPDSDN